MRALAILAVSAVLGQHTVELVHALTVEHTRCAEHGELLHKTAETDGSSEIPGIVAAPIAEGERHDHCAVDWLSRFQVGAESPTFAVLLIELQVDTHTLPPAIPTSTALLRFAPKTSPPIS